jgi:CRISPR-associated protein Cmr2
VVSHDKRILHFTLGPVQGFVGQARRTRDLWAGSYLLSYLAGHAMGEVDNTGESIVFPDVKDDPLFLAIRGKSTPTRIDDAAASVGSLPNRFKASVPEKFDAKKCAEAVIDKWKDVAGKVYSQLDNVLKAAGIAIKQDVWASQVENQWEIAWAVGEDDALLDMRKNFRTHVPPPEEDEKCTVCGERQEVSGKGMGTGTSRKAMGEWWAKLRNQLDETRKLHQATLFDLKEGERLCAVYLVKRAYPFREVARQAIRWEVPVNYPSTSYMAAVDWVIRVFEESRHAEHGAKVQEAVRAYIDAATEADVWLAETATHIDGISTAGSASGLNGPVVHRGKRTEWQFFADLDGDAFFKSAIRNPQEFEVDGDITDTDPRWVEKSKENPNRKALEEALDRLQKALPEKAGLARAATPFYALLLMDGDGMGKLLSGYSAHQGNIAKALALFTQEVPKIVARCNGKLIHAGGDDVFALLPIDRAIECAQECRKAYISAFDTVFGHPRRDGVPREHETTVSVAIEFAHMQTALGVVVRDAHKLLDEIAKDRCSRDGLACRVWKRGGLILTWAQPWTAALEVVPTAAAGTPPSNLIEEVKRLFQDASPDPGKFSSKFFYKLRDIFELIAPEGPMIVERDAAQKILVAEYLATRERAWDPNWSQERIRDEAGARVERLLALCHARKRDACSGAIQDTHSYSADGALLVRFLSQKEL